MLKLTHYMPRNDKIWFQVGANGGHLGFMQMSMKMRYFNLSSYMKHFV